MKRFIKPFIAYFFLLCLAVSMVPLAVFHQHEEHEHEHCELSDAELALDPCHIAVYHSDKLHNHQCDHKAHFDAEEEHCPVCELQFSYDEKYSLLDGEKVCCSYISNIQFSRELADPSCSFVQFSFSRGPPA